MLEASPTSLQLGEGFSDKVSASHDKALPRTTSLRLASDNLLVRTSSLRLRPRHGLCKRGATSTHKLPRQFHTPCKHISWQHPRAAGSDESLNAALFGCVALDAPSHPTLQHANSDRSTRVPPTFSAGLRLGRNMALMLTIRVRHTIDTKIYCLAVENPDSWRAR
jgi:hypothetical protein